MAAIAALPKEKATGGEAAAANARSRLYLLLSRAVSFPESDAYDEIASGSWFQELAPACAALPYRLNPGAASKWRAPDDYDAFQSEYIRLFEVGARGRAPYPLNSGHHTPDRLRTMEELVRFYNFFGLKLAPGLMPDHASVELEFMHYLAAKEAEETGAAGPDRDSYLYAQRDFVTRQLLNWWPAVAAKLKGERALPFYRSFASLITQFLDLERKYLERAIATGT